MPYKYIYEKKKIPKELDRRVKLTDKKRKEITEKHAQGISMRAISREVELDRNVIKYVLFPKHYEKLKQQFKARRLDGRYKPTKEKRNATMREHRKYKQSIKDKLI